MPFSGIPISLLSGNFDWSAADIIKNEQHETSFTIPEPTSRHTDGLVYLHEKYVYHVTLTI